MPARANATSSLTAPPRPRLASEALYGPAGEFVDLVSDTSEADQAGLLVSMLVCSGAAFGRSAFGQHGHSLHRPSNFAVTFAELPSVRQSDYLDPVQAFLRTVVPQAGTDLLQFASIGCIRSGDKLLAASAMIAEGKKPPLVAVGEFDTTLVSLGRRGNTLSAAYRHIWDHGGNVAIMSHCREGDLLEAKISGSTLETASRFLWCYVERKQTLSSPPAPPPDKLARLAQAVAVSVKQAEGLGKVSFDASAQKLWEEEYASLISRRSDAAGIVQSRGDAHVLRLSLIYALLDSSIKVCIPHLEAALALWDYCYLSADRLFGLHAEDAVAGRVLDALKGGLLSQTQLHAVLNNHSPGAQLKTVLTNLVTEGRIVPEVSSTRGRSRTTWRLSDSEGADSTRPTDGH
jgi:hypothetical protein